MNYLTTQCKARMQPLRSLAWSGNGVGVPVLRCMYISTIRSVIEYASPILFCLDGGRSEKLERIQNEAMRIILSCPQNAMIDAMRHELSLPLIKHRIEEVNIATTIKHIKGKGGSELLKDITNCINNVRTFRKQGKRGYIRHMVNKLQEYDVGTCVTHTEISKPPPPWQNKLINIDIMPLKRKKNMYDVSELKNTFEKRIQKITDEKISQVYCDGWVMQDGRAGCGIIIKDFAPEVSLWVEKELSYRLSNDISSTQAELYAIFVGLRELRGGEGDVYFFIDSRAATESLSSRNPVLQNIATQCTNIITELDRGGRRLTFMWLPSHVGIIDNERVDETARKATMKEQVDIVCDVTVRQIKTKIRQRQQEIEQNNITHKSTVRPSNTMAHYVQVANNIPITYG